VDQWRRDFEKESDAAMECERNGGGLWAQRKAAYAATGKTDDGPLIVAVMVLLIGATVGKWAGWWLC